MHTCSQYQIRGRNRSSRCYYSPIMHYTQVSVKIRGRNRSSKCMQQFGISAGGPSGPSGSHLVSQSALLPFWSLHVACLDLFSVGWMKCDCFGPDCFEARARPRGPSIWQTNIGEAGRPVAVSLQNVIKATGHAAMLFEAILFYLWWICGPHMSCFVCTILQTNRRSIILTITYGCRGAYWSNIFSYSFSPLLKLTNLWIVRVTCPEIWLWYLCPAKADKAPRSIFNIFSVVNC